MEHSSFIDTLYTVSEIFVIGAHTKVVDWIVGRYSKAPTHLVGISSLSSLPKFNPLVYTHKLSFYNFLGN